jgi:hypothetical protein
MKLLVRTQSILAGLALISLSSSLLQGCKAREAAGTRLKVVNGKPIADDSVPAVIQIQVAMGGGMSAACTATWVSDSTVLTAAHCITDARGDSSKISVSRGTGKGLKAVKHYIHSSYLRSEANGRDIAVLQFPKNSSNVFIPMALTQAKSGDDLIIIGFGKFDHKIGSSGGKKRIGTNKVRDVDYAGRIMFDGMISPTDKTGTGENVTNSQGDSGGPMIINNRVAGVSSSVNSNPTPEGKLRGNYESVRYPETESWLLGLAKAGVYMVGITPGTENIDPGKIDSPAPSGGAPSPQPENNGGPQDSGAPEAPEAPEAPNVPGSSAPGGQNEIANPPQNPPPSSSGGSGTTALDCNRDYSKIRQGGTGVCINSSSGFCYNYSGGDVRYNMGRVACSSSGGSPSGVSRPSTPKPSDNSQGGLYECNLDYSKIRAGGSGICLNGSSGFCYRFSSGDVRYSSGSVTCP